MIGIRVKGPAAAKRKPSAEEYNPGEYLQEALAFLRERIGETEYEQIMGRADSRWHPYVAARLFLSPMDWERYVWIEHHGTLDGFI